MFDIIREMVGEFPISVKKVSPSWDLTNALQIALVKMNAKALFNFMPLVDVTNGRRLTLSLDQSGLTLGDPRNYQENATQPFFEYVLRLCGYLNMKFSEFVRFSRKALRFERKLAKFYRGEEELSKLSPASSRRKRRFGDVCKEFDSVDLR